ncbi:sugar ABC transporter ATP-binding protein [Cryobacterium sp. TMS1-20-1]|uniref:sugar ABC transporter ATP-binding protein n=1 Tax=Cryobacterium sp. TMS1-20-1 TaxID=1259223 RepID=UPI00106DC110|nr:sugar ABC transporter ATP-binding protein [Cryobacterium sp. TMS1-20-1]TFC80534.1 sugar ABC transporter ATP-binding protein [Cryobacterium sp. TMS1-20-1]
MFRGEDLTRDASGGLPMVTIAGLTKQFVGTRALDQVDLQIAAGEIHALCGGNGSGKSTLIKILAGIERGDGNGKIVVGDRTVRADSITAEFSHAAGVRVVHQDLGIFPDMRVSENLMLGSGYPRGPIGNIRWKAVKKRANELIARFDIAATPDTLMDELAPAMQTQIAIARALQDVTIGEPGLLILDEPTTALPPHEVDKLFAALRRYAAEGLSIVIVTHRLDEVLKLSDRVTVLRDGTRLGTWQTRNLTESDLVGLIVGREIDLVHRDASAVTGEVALALRNVCADRVEDVSFDVRQGEIVGIAGLIGSGRTELLRTVFGDLALRSGTIRVGGSPVGRTPTRAMAAGIAFIPENRKAEAAFLDQSITENIGIAVLKTYWRRLRIDNTRMKLDVERLVKSFDVKSYSPMQELQTLSGGN